MSKRWTAAMITLGFTLTSCSVQGSPDTSLPPTAGSQSIEDVCSVVEKHKDRYLQTMSASTSTNELANFTTSIAALGDIKLMWTELAGVAPSDIRADFEATRDAWIAAEQAGASSDAIGALANALFNAGSLSRVNRYIADNCGASYAPVAIPETAEPVESTQAGPPLLDMTWTDPDGYEYRVVLDGPATYTPTVDIANAPPGKAQFDFALETTGTLYNLTPQRNAQVPAGLGAAVVWPKTDLACTILGEQNNAPVTEEFCGRAFEMYAASTELPPDGSIELVAGLSNVFPLSIDEASVDSVTSNYGAPHAWVVYARSSNGRVPEACLSLPGVC